jgi:hypothetical protein
VNEKEQEMNTARLTKKLVSVHSAVVLALVSAMGFTTRQEPSPSAAGMQQVKVFVFVQRTDRHGKYSSSEVFHNAMNDLLEYLKGNDVAIAVDEFGGRTYAESATPMETVFNIARDAKASNVLYVMVDRPKAKWIQITAQCYDMSGNQVWKEEASNGNGDMGGGQGLKTAEKRMREKLNQHVGKEGLPVVGSKEAVGEKK